MLFKLFLLFETFLMSFPSSWRKNFFAFLAKVAYYTSHRYRQVSYQNLDFLFNNTMSHSQKDEITRYAFRNLSFNFLHAMELRHMSKEELQNKVTIQNREAVQKVHDEGRAVIYITTHYSSWELGGASIGAFIEPLIAVYKKMKNQDYQRWLLQARDRFGNISMEKSKVVKPLVKNLKKGLACGLLIDTNINKKEGLIINFMGKKLRQTSTPAFLARKFNAAIIPVTIRTDDEDNYTLMLFDEIKVEHTDDIDADILKATQAQADWLGGLIQKEPKFWFWLHRRFKNDHPHIYEKE
ncbi:MAG: lipid A biosynthesis acyltransferase [Sulfurimonas sp.]|nr:lipid A biosynthesis acyltransferase [Sulfurimonas sp.]